MNLKEGRTTVKDAVPGGHSKWRKQKVKQYYKEPEDELTSERMGRTRRTHFKYMTNMSVSPGSQSHHRLD